MTVCGVGVAWSIASFVQHHHATTTSLMTDLLVHIAWPPVLWLVTFNSFVIPIRYAFRPPTIPNHAQLLKRDPVLRVSYPQDIKTVRRPEPLTRSRGCLFTLHGLRTRTFHLYLVYVRSYWIDQIEARWYNRCYC